MRQALERAVTIAGSQTALANMIGTSQTHVWYWLNKAKRLPAERAVQIEQATGVPRHELRPDIWQEEEA
jgi:DNA-binding transcriptional regulator YdaS (Cro superfamily)